eukprot:gb/GECG01009954.1/.p1 GENE.gb/GECG01009954.1/~~gb/GECG01009954.1/.p1  ORF type:complete len:166 (+),score=4.60 gb/GECG01009954.1/:1-498(+)
MLLSRLFHATTCACRRLFVVRCPMLPGDSVMRAAGQTHRRITPFSLPIHADPWGLGRDISPSMWDELMQPITDKDICNACRSKRSASGRTRVSHRMVLYAHSQIRQAIAAVLTDVLQTGDVPAVYKVALLRPIPKEVGKPIEEAARPIVRWRSTQLVPVVPCVLR